MVNGSSGQFSVECVRCSHIVSFYGIHKIIMNAFVCVCVCPFVYCVQMCISLVNALNLYYICIRLIHTFIHPYVFLYIYVSVMYKK